MRNKFDGDKGKGGETVQLNFDFPYYTKCKLPQKPFFVKKYYINEGEQPGFLDYSGRFPENAIVFIASLNKDVFKDNDPPENVLMGHYIALRICTEGKDKGTNLISTSKKQTVGEEGNNQPATQCGLSTILSYLCYRDREVEPSIKGSGIGYDFSMELAKTENDEKQAAQNLKRFTEQKCQRIIKVFSLPSVGGRAYVYAAMDTGYQYLLVFEKKEEDGFTKVKTATLSEEFQKEENKPYVKGGFMVVDPVLDPFLKKHGKHWFFCKLDLTLMT